MGVSAQKILSSKRPPILSWNWFAPQSFNILVTVWSSSIEQLEQELSKHQKSMFSGRFK